MSLGYTWLMSTSWGAQTRPGRTQAIRPVGQFTRTEGSAQRQNRHLWTCSGQEIKDIHSTYQDIYNDLYVDLQSSAGSRFSILIKGQVRWQDGLLFPAFTNGEADADVHLTKHFFQVARKDRRIYGASAWQRRHLIDNRAGFWGYYIFGYCTSASSVSTSAPHIARWCSCYLLISPLLSLLLNTLQSAPVLSVFQNSIERLCHIRHRDPHQRKQELGTWAPPMYRLQEHRLWISLKHVLDMGQLSRKHQLHHFWLFWRNMLFGGFSEWVNFDWNISFHSQHLHHSPRVSVQEMMFVFFTSTFTTTIELLEDAYGRKWKTASTNGWIEPEPQHASGIFAVSASQDPSWNVVSTVVSTKKVQMLYHVVKIESLVMRFCLCSRRNSPGKATVGNTSRIRDVSLPCFGIFGLVLSVCFLLYLSVSAMILHIESYRCISMHIDAYCMLHSHNLCQDSHRVENAADHAFRTAKNLEEAH